jgi:hypothetical protein
MNLVLKRKEFRADGIFSELMDESGNQVAVTLDHAYPTDGGFKPKIPDGRFICKRGLHRLEGMTHDFETFEICGVEGHTNLLFHQGNFNKDSEGCLLLGTSFGQNGAKGAKMVLFSKVAFGQFMKLMDGVDEFELTVTS